MSGIIWDEESLALDGFDGIAPPYDRELQVLVSSQGPRGFWTVGCKFHQPDGIDRHFRSLRQALRHARAVSNRHAGITMVFGQYRYPDGGVYCGCGGLDVVADEDYQDMPSESDAYNAYSIIRRQPLTAR